MSKKQTRRSISVSRETYDRLQTYCQANGTTGSGVVEDLVRKFLGMEERAPNLRKPPVPRVERAAPIEPPRVQQMKEIQAAKVTKAETSTREVVVSSPVLEKNGDWEKKAAPIEPPADGKKNGTPLGDLASKIFTF